jgi:hypothetical protein
MKLREEVLMKTIQNVETKEVKRLSDPKALEIVNAPESVWKFVPKSFWKNLKKESK